MSNKVRFNVSTKARKHKKSAACTWPLRHVRIPLSAVKRAVVEPAKCESRGLETPVKQGVMIDAVAQAYPECPPPLGLTFHKDSTIVRFRRTCGPKLARHIDCTSQATRCCNRTALPPTPSSVTRAFATLYKRSADLRRIGPSRVTLLSGRAAHRNLSAGHQEENRSR